MLKNKWLAIGLSILAVVLIAYRLFFDKGTSVMPMQNQAPLLVQTPESEPLEESTDGTVNPEWGNTGTDMMIDPDSPLLLQRVSPSPETDSPYEPMVSQFGMEIFVKPRPAAQASPAEGEAVQAVSLELNAIVIDEPRRFAIVNRQLVKAGDFVDGAEILLIEPGRVVYRLNGEDLVLEAIVAPLSRPQDGG